MTVKLLIKDGKFCLSFPYDEKMVEKAKSIPGASWDKVEKMWKYPLTKLTYLALKKTFGIAHEEAEKSLQKCVIPLDKYKFRTPPYKHQLEGVIFLLEQFGVTCINWSGK